MSTTSERARAAVGVADHAGWAVLMTVRQDGVLLDRRRVELLEPGLPAMPHHHEGQALPLDEAVSLVERVRASAQRTAALRLEEVAAEVDADVVSIALRTCPALPATVAERITNYRAMCVADWVMYREALAHAATGRGWAVHAYDAKSVLGDMSTGPARETIDALLEAARVAFGRPWQKDHRSAMAAAIRAFG